MTDYIEILDFSIEGSVERCVRSVDRFGLLFSGGLDSSLLAKYCLDLGKRPILISVFMKGSGDEAHVREAAAFFNLEFLERKISEQEVETYAKKVSIAASTQDLLDVSIGIPIYAALDAASGAGIETVVMGQGADELFGGYHRYLQMPPDQLDKELRKDVETINTTRDIAIAEACDMRLILPYLDEVVVEAGLAIPIDWKIRKETRKYVLREVAKKRGLPELIWAREKKAIQYSTGVDKVLRKSLKKIDFTLS